MSVWLQTKRYLCGPLLLLIIYGCYQINFAQQED
jgi:hypothetical protein